ncbi:hypothetical protein ACFX2C_009741 [Malus domestica]
MQCATSGATKICGEDFACLDDWNCLFLRHAANEFIRDFSSDSNEQIDWPQIPQAWMGLTPMIALSIWIIIYEIIYKNRLDYYYYTIAAFGVLNFVYFHFFARHYMSNDVDQHSEKPTNSESSDDR